jgi:hypothetical protein
MSINKAFRITGSAATQNAIKGIEGVGGAMKRAKDETVKATVELEKAGKKIEDVKKSSDGFGNVTKGLTQTLGSFGGTIGSVASRFGVYGLAAGAAVGATLAIGKGIDSVLTHAVKYDSVMASLPYNIDAAKSASLGMIDSFELAKIAIRTNRLEAAKSSEDFAELVHIATTLALSMGEDAAPMIDSLTKGIARQSPLLVDNAGIQVSIAEANQRYAEALGKTTIELTDAEKQQAFTNEVLRKGRAAAEESSVAISELARDWADAKTAMADYWDAFKSGLAGGISGAYAAYKDMLRAGRSATEQGLLVAFDGLFDSQKLYGEVADAYQFGAAQSPFRGVLELKSPLEGIRDIIRETRDLTADDVRNFIEKGAEIQQHLSDEQMLLELRKRAAEDAKEELDLERMKVLAAREGLKIKEFEAEKEREREQAEREAERARKDAQRAAEQHAAKVRDLALANIAAAESEAQRERERMEIAGITRFETIAAQEHDKIRFIEQRLALTKEERDRIGLRNEIAQAEWDAEKQRHEERKRQHAEAVALAQAVVDENRRQAEDQIALQQWAIDKDLEQRLLAVENLAANGLDPITRMDLEFAAEQQALERRLELMAQEQVAEEEKTAHLIEQDRLRQQIETNSLKHAMARAAAMKKADEERKKSALATQSAIAGTVGAMTSQIAGHLAAEREAYGISEKALRGIRATEMFITAGVQTVEAAVAFASQNYPKGAMHVAAAALATATGAMIASGAGQYAPAKVTAGSSAANAGGGRSGGSSRNSERSGELPEVPLSRPGSGGSGASLSGMQSPTPVNRASNGPTYNITVNSHSLGKLDEEETVLKVRQAIRKSERNYGAI